MIFYYSGCGNSRYVAESLAKAGTDGLVFIPQALRKSGMHYDLREGEAVGFVFPIYSWRPPQIVLDFVRGVDLSAAPGYIYMVATYGDDAGVADRVLAEALAGKGLRLDAAFGVTMPNTYVNMSFMNVDSKEVAQRKLAAARDRVVELARAVGERRRVVDVHRGAMPRFKTRLIGMGFNKWVSDKDYHTTGACVGCGECVRVCPVENITLEEGHPRWHGSCLQCEACYHYCPQNAVQFGKATRGKGQYRFED